jgi:hypothetical protein
VDPGAPERRSVLAEVTRDAPGEVIVMGMRQQFPVVDNL